MVESNEAETEKPDTVRGRPRVSLLSREELDVSRLAAQGETVAGICEKLHLNENQVEQILSDAAAMLHISKDGKQSSFADAFDLTEMQATVCQEAANGSSNEEIAERLHITKGTVKVHLRTAFKKLGVSKRTELVNIFGADYVIDTPHIEIVGFERSVLNRISQGLTDPQIATALNATLGTVQTAIRELIKLVNGQFMLNHPDLFTPNKSEQSKSLLISNRTQLAAWWSMNNWKKNNEK